MKVYRHYNYSTLTTEVEEVTEEVAGLVECLKLWDGALFKINPQ